MADPAPEVVIVGGGVIGCAIAYDLAREGARVTVVERAHIAAESSGAAAGILAPRVHATADAMFPLALASQDLFEPLVAELSQITGMSVDYARCPVLDLADDAGAEATLRTKVDWLRGIGHDVTWLGPDDVRALEPALRPGYRGAFHDADAYQIHPLRFTQALAEGAARRGVSFVLGVEVLGLIHNGARVTGVQTSQGPIHASQTVLVGGAWMEAAGQWLGLPIAIYPAKGQILTLEIVPQPIHHTVFGADAYLMPRRDGTIVVGATVENHGGYDKRLTADGIGWLLNVAPRLCPTLADAQIYRMWSGLLVTDLILHRGVSELLKPLDPGRFIAS